MCETHGPTMQKIQDVRFLSESSQIAMAVFDGIALVMQIINLCVP